MPNYIKNKYCKICYQSKSYHKLHDLDHFFKDLERSDKN